MALRIAASSLADGRLLRSFSVGRSVAIASRSECSEGTFPTRGPPGPCRRYHAPSHQIRPALSDVTETGPCRIMASLLHDPGEELEHRLRHAIPGLAKLGVDG